MKKWKATQNWNRPYKCLIKTQKLVPKKKICEKNKKQH